MVQAHIFNKKLQKWVKLVAHTSYYDVQYVDSKSEAHIFDFLEILAARDALESFYLYPADHYVAPLGTNLEISECAPLLLFIKEEKKRMNDRVSMRG
jgi:hypothetical protein